MSSLVFYVHHMFLNLRLVFFKDLQKKSLLKRPFTVSIHPSTFPTIPSLDAFHCQALTATSLVYATIIRAAVPPCHRRSRWPTGAGCRNPVSPVVPWEIEKVALFLGGWWTTRGFTDNRALVRQDVLWCGGCFFSVFGCKCHMEGERNGCSFRKEWSLHFEGSLKAICTDCDCNSRVLVY